MLRSLLVTAGSAVIFGCGGGSPPDVADASSPTDLTVPEAAAAADASATDDTLASADWDLEQELENVTYRETKGTVLQWELHADRVLQRPGIPAKLHAVTLRYYSGSDQAVVITADEADFDTDKQDAVLRGNVHVSGANGDVLESDELVWNSQTQRVSTESNVVLRRGKSYIEGTGLDTSPGLQDAKIFNVSGIIQEQELRG